MSEKLLHSHARDGDLPGTFDLRAVEGDDTAYGQALFPVPAEDPNDPLQWATWKKTMILIICSLYSFLANSALLGPSVYISIYAEEFDISPTVSSGLVSYPNLAFGFGSLILVPMYLKIGRRPVMVGSIMVYLAGLIGCSRATSYGGLMAARIIAAFASSVCEALPVQLVNDIFFLHERGKRIGYYTVCLCLGSTGPLYAGYMLAGGYDWRLFFYVEAAFAAALLIMAFLFVEETLYIRKLPSELTVAASSDDEKGRSSDPEKSSTTNVHNEVAPQAIPPRKTFLSTLKLWGAYDPSVSVPLTMIRPFTYYCVPAVFWVVTSYGIYIGLGALTFNYTFPIIITKPPYNWSQTSSGLIAVASAVGYFLAIPFTFTSDWIAAKLTRRNGGIREAEMRLSALLPAMLMCPAGLILYGFTAQRQLHWIGYFAGVAMNNWGSYFYFSFTLAYAVDSYYTATSEMLIAMNLGKQAISFGMGSYLLNWILEDGYLTIVAGIFTGLALLNNLQVITFMVFGKRIRKFISKTPLARFHRGLAAKAEATGTAL